MKLASALRDAPRPALLVAVAVALGAAALLSGGDLGGAAARAVAVVALLGLGAAALRARRGVPPGPGALRILERHALSRDCGVALVVAGTQRLVVGFGPQGVRLVSELVAVGRDEKP